MPMPKFNSCGADHWSSLPIPSPGWVSFLYYAPRMVKRGRTDFNDALVISLALLFVFFFSARSLHDTTTTSVISL
jgi:hypothetical protein